MFPRIPLLKERRLILCAARLTESRHFSNVGRGTFRSKIYLPVITPWHWRFPGVSRPVTVRVRARVSLSSAFFLCIPPGARPCPHYNGITCPHITLAVPARNTHFSPRSAIPMPSLIFFSSDTSVPDISYIVIRSLCGIYRTSGERVSREHHRKIELEMARPDKMSDTAIASARRNSVKL